MKVAGRNLVLRIKSEAVPADVLRQYSLTSFLATHYAAPAAAAQKVDALAGRAEPQARDVFDLNLLLARADGVEVMRSLPKARLAAAMEHALEITYEQYAAQVVAYLDPTQGELDESRDAWNVMQDAVVATLEAAQ